MLLALYYLYWQYYNRSDCDIIENKADKRFEFTAQVSVSLAFNENCTDDINQSNSKWNDNDLSLSSNASEKNVLFCIGSSFFYLQAVFNECFMEVKNKMFEIYVHIILHVVCCPRPVSTTVVKTFDLNLLTLMRCLIDRNSDGTANISPVGQLSSKKDEKQLQAPLSSFSEWVNHLFKKARL